MRSILVIILMIGVIWWGIAKMYDNWENEEKKPFWSGTERIQVCKKPYYSDEDCYKLPVTNIDDTAAKIHFNNGGYKITEDLTCYFAGKMNLNGQKRYVFCRSWDDENQQWDFLPMGVDY